MRKLIGLATLLLVPLAACSQSKPKESPALAWAYPRAASPNIPNLGPGPFKAPGSARTATLAEVMDDKNPVDWFPGEHPPTPTVVAHKQKGGPTPCAECHLYDGHGFLGAADLAGLPAAYIIEQVQAFRSGDRQSSQQPDRPDTTEMIKVARQVSDTDLAAAAAWFAALPRHPFVRVVESDTAPKTLPSAYGLLDMAPGGGTEPLAGRIVEVTEDEKRLYLADPHVGFVAYVPPGAVARGAALVKSGGPNGQPCAGCHGKELKGQGPAPPLAGRAPTYLARMLWDIKTGARGGPTVAQMKGPASGLNEAQITDVVAYLASLHP